MSIGGFAELLNALDTRFDEFGDELLESQQIQRTDAVERAVYKGIPKPLEIVP